MKSTRSKKLLAKYFTGSISTTELDDLMLWLEKKDTEDLFISSSKIDHAIRNNMSQYNTKKTEKLLLDRIRKDKNFLNRFKIKKFFKYAAAAVLFISIGYFSHNNFKTANKNDVTTTNKNEIILQLEDGNIKILSEDGTERVVNNDGTIIGSQKGNQLIYDNKATIEKLVYNTLTVPYGKRFELRLSDGTHIFLNSGTSLKYPIKFLKGKERQVYLNGEAFFDVTKDTDHPFIVNMNNVGVRVFGTKFNASSYPENDEVNTVLVEGSVSIFNNNMEYNKNSASLLKPGFIASWNKHNKEISIEKADIAMHTAWIEGRILFRHLPFKNIIRKLERHYDVTIINNNKKLDEEFFTASFDIETIEQVLEVFHKNYNINYSIINDQIIIN
ncbi:FecR family protein [Gillisia sp. Hel_I_86]|uniref:FecR family protein n=1 Tax=Gillisia sp. Hel_I_86 TaxID=1249981 RepID=UPI00119BF801|nr:FecR family protein [Gillisia sp. Hel_I_86]TVZ25217.1 FecR family protein [Gillisia sp. Hel_I_86]